MNGLDEAGWLVQCEGWFAEANRGCGLSYDLFQQTFSASVEAGLRRLPEALRERAVEIAAELGYATTEELARAQHELASMGCCSHGLDRACCPAGCGDLE